LIASDLGFEEEAQRIFDELAATQFDFPIDARRNITLSYLAEICTRLRRGPCRETLPTVTTLSGPRLACSHCNDLLRCHCALSRHVGRRHGRLGGSRTAL
jgi:hypothetical protein